MTRASAVLLLALLTANQSLAASKPTQCKAADSENISVKTESAAVAAAKAAWIGKLSSPAIEAREPYHARLQDGVWHVSGTLPTGWRGGTPEAEICATDGRVLRVLHSQ